MFYSFEFQFCAKLQFKNVIEQAFSDKIKNQIDEFHYLKDKLI